MSSPSDWSHKIVAASRPFTLVIPCVPRHAGKDLSQAVGAAH
jgi:hypothetical protein